MLALLPLKICRDNDLYPQSDIFLTGKFCLFFTDKTIDAMPKPTPILLVFQLIRRYQ